ncbi:hypothetical protein [Ruegeria arenilitoris]|uniref:hypothetical protein n=1 Tax=Ruegeria arenilitoris TaxID=1173585 RepID=UPI00147EEF4C|nr:hypothetical protein [Ruegeria arenilitoris]
MKPMTLRDEELIGAIKHAAANGYGVKVEDAAELRTARSIVKALNADVRLLIYNPATEANDNAEPKT